MAARGARSLAFVKGALGTLILTQACVDDGVSMHVICSIPPEIGDDSCTWDAAGDTCTVEGVLNTRTAAYYRMSLRVESGLTARARAVPPLAEPNGLQLHSASIELRNTSGATLGLGTG